MIRREGSRGIVIFLPILLLSQLTICHAGAPSTLKNLVNLYAHSPNDNSNLTGLNQVQNEYLYRRILAKSTLSDRYKSTTPSNAEAVFDQSPSDLGNPGSLDYNYQDNRGTTNVPECRGRIKLNGTRGFITDGPGNYPTNLQCVWMIDSGRDNATIRIHIHQFNTECNYDYLYIFDGDSIYSPLVAALSGDIIDFSSALEPNLDSIPSNIRTNSTSSPSNNSTNYVSSVVGPESRVFELKTISGKAFVYFHSDTAQSMSGFYMTYSVDSCSLDCSNRGECDYSTLTCKCNPGYYGDGCQYVLCPNNCTSPQHGICDIEKSCMCKDGYDKPDCSVKRNQPAWIRLIGLKNDVPPRAFHQSIVVDGVMWVIGGKVQSLSNPNSGIFRQKKTEMVHSFNIEAQTWSDLKLEGITGIDHLAELAGHSVAAKGFKIFIFGGIAMNNTVLDVLTVLDTKTSSLSTIPNGKKSKNSDEEFAAPIAVIGHTANIIDSHMYVFLGFNPLYGYINFVQKFNLANNSWSIVERKGSSIDGCIGHTSTYDSVNKLVYVFGGHHTHRRSSLYSFDPHTEVWTLLQSSPSPRYYHNSVVIYRQLIVLGGNSYNTSHHSDQCFQQSYLTYDLGCSMAASDVRDQSNTTFNQHFECGRKCWQTLEDTRPGILKRHGHSVVNYENKELILFGGFNGMMLNDLRLMNISSCGASTTESECMKPKLALSCYWNAIETRCEDQQPKQSDTSASVERPHYNCTKSDQRTLEHICESRDTCTQCLNTNIGCVWCGIISQCQYNKCLSASGKAILDPSLCYKDELLKSSLMSLGGTALKDVPLGQDIDTEMECKRIDNCFLCNSTPQCSWVNDGCSYNSPAVIPSPTSSFSPAPLEDFNDFYGGSNLGSPRTPPMLSDSTRFMQRFDPFNRSFLAQFTTSLFNSSPYHSCDAPCYKRPSCNECTTTKCIWCSTTEQCIDSSAYFAYHAMGQCMHYVAHMSKCPVASCADIETCDKCLTNPKCGWLNDISNTGKGRCIEGTSNGPSFSSSSGIEPMNSTSNSALVLPNWFYTSCPACQCNGHSYCKANSGLCVQPCQDNTEGAHCEKCISGHSGDPINGGNCRACRCNGHAQSCNRETGKCYCSTKGIIGHSCNKCDDQNHYIGDPSGNGTCYYNLTTDYQYTFNMSKPEDHFYSDINFINVPLRKDSDVDFTIACSRLALVNITSGTSYKTRKLIHASMECGSFRLRFPHERHSLTETNYSFFVHVYKFQTPFILQIAFSQHRTLYLPQFFFTFSSCFLFFFALSGFVWKLKHEYDLYVRRQRQFIEMEQMASRPFSTILLEVFTKPAEAHKAKNQAVKPPTEPTPISFEPCFGSNVGVLSLFVQLPGRPNLAIGSALVTLNEDVNSICDDNSSAKRTEKELASVQNI